MITKFIFHYCSSKIHPSHIGFLTKMWVQLFLLGFVSSGFCDKVQILDRPEIFIQNALVPQLDGRIVGGYPVNISEHPHQTSLQNWHSHSCGGSLISPEWILTAAHCLASVGPHRYTFRLGSSLWANGGTLVSATQVIRHPLYNSATIDYDVAVVKIAPAQDITEVINYATLPPDGWYPEPGAIATVTGWGTPFSGGSLMAELQEVQVPIVSNESCDQYYREWLPNNMNITDRMMCAGFVDGGYDACQGDSGGPLITSGYLVGIVSWGNGCAFANYPGVYASVPNLLPWIKEHTGL